MPVLELVGLKHGYPSPEGGRLSVLDIPSFSLRAGQQLALEGASGSGKTTLLHCCAGILRPEAGRVLLDGRDLAAMDEAQADRWRARRLGLVFQSFHLLQSLSALENVELAMRFGAGLERGRARRLLERVGLADRLHHRPAQLSAGQQQRVAVARALANRPCLVLADEPTGNLDPDAARAVLDLLRRSCAEDKAALLLASHDPRALRRLPRRRLASLNRAPKPRRRP